MLNGRCQGVRKRVEINGDDSNSISELFFYQSMSKGVISEWNKFLPTYIFTRRIKRVKMIEVREGTAKKIDQWSGQSDLTLT